MKWILAGALSAAMLGGSGAALAQPYVYYPPVYHYGYYQDYGGRDYDEGRYYNDWRHDNGRHRGWYKHRRYRHYYGYYPYRYQYYAPVRVCSWRFGERVCWWTR